MEYIAHRVNTIEELKNTPNEYGVEIDLRDFGDRLILQHDPFTDGEDFEEYLKNYKHGTMILNIKSERIEYTVLKLIKKYNIKEYFFLDSTFPMIHFLSKGGEKNIALRLSEFEGMDTIFNMSGEVKWVWVDCFTTFPISKIIYNKIRALGYKICIVSPELQGQDNKIEIYGEYMKKEGFVPDAICSKIYNKPRWDNFSF